LIAVLKKNNIPAAKLQALKSGIGCEKEILSKILIIDKVKITN
jgi:hypothetical protein